MRTDFSWKFPDGFAPFRSGDLNDSWLAGFLDEFASDDIVLRAAMQRVVEDCLGRADQPDSWAIMLGDFGNGRNGIVGIAEAAFTDVVDVAQWAARWQRDFAAADAPRGESLFVDSKRSPAAIRRSVDLREIDGVNQYVEQGVIVKTWPRLDVSGVLRITASSLVTFPDLMTYLRTFVQQFEIEENSRVGG